MIKINKDVNDIPPSLRTDVISIKHNPAKTTNDRRLELISAGRYINSSLYASRYKTRDIKDRLKSLYKNCCFCGFHDQQLEVEHYRPKSKYYWLTYSWDNLLFSCTKCNKAKSDKFSISGLEVAIKADYDLSGINCLSDIYDLQEKPMLINPEKITEDESAAFVYEKDGHVHSDNPRVDYTIKTCDLDRDNLVEERKAIWDKFVNSINARKWKYRDDMEALKVSLYDAIEDFIAEAKDDNIPLISFRRYVIKSEWINELLKF